MASLDAFFWAWWVAWAAFIGLFLARISRGRTIREFVTGTLILPFTYTVMWVTHLRQRGDRPGGSQGNADFGEAGARLQPGERLLCPAAGASGFFVVAFLATGGRPALQHHLCGLGVRS